MKSNEWAKTILYVYKYLERVADGIDKLVMQNALNSFYTRGEKQGENGVMAVSERIIELSARKSRLVNIKVLADEALLDIDRYSAQLLIERYMDNAEADMIAAKHNLNVRTYFRHLKHAEEDFCRSMSRKGFNQDKLEKYLAQEKWILEVYEKFVSERKIQEEQQSKCTKSKNNSSQKKTLTEFKQIEKERNKAKEDFEDCLMVG